MANRKKRLKKGIESLKKQIQIHEEKKQEAEEQDNEKLVRYYEYEIENLEKVKKQKKEMLKK